MIPGEDLVLPESDLLQEIGKYFMLLQHEQKKRMILAQAYNELKAELDSIKQPKFTADEVVIGNP